jgi:hypothetical protein
MFSEIVKLVSAVAWPILLISVLWIFREQIRTLIVSRTFKFGPQGIEVAVPQQPSGETESQKLEHGLAPMSSPARAGSREVAANPSAAYSLPSFREFVTEVEQRVERELPSYMTQIGRSREDSLKHLAIDNMGALFLERTSRHLFGSQIDAINFLLANNGRSTIQNLRPLYASAASNFPTIYANYSFDQWLAFLTTWNLIRIDGDDAVLTPAGKAIITYMQIWGYLLQKPPG